MALTVISSWGGGTSNSYIDYTDAVVYLESKLYTAPWTAVGSLVCEKALVEATRRIDAINWRGDRYFTFQKLAFPRAITALYPDLGAMTEGVWSQLAAQNDEYTRMYNNVRDATVEEAVYLLDNMQVDARGRATPFAERISMLGVGSFNDGAGGVSEGYYFAKSPYGLSREAYMLLKEWFGAVSVKRG